MLPIAILLVALVAMFALKAFAIAKTGDELFVNSASFSWASARTQDAQRAAAWAAEEQAAQEAQPVLAGLHPAKGLHA